MTAPGDFAEMINPKEWSDQDWETYEHFKRCEENWGEPASPGGPFPPGNVVGLDDEEGEPD